MRRSRLVPAALFALPAGTLAPTAPVAPAAPIPQHLMPKEEPFLYPTHVGDRHVSALAGRTIVCVVAKVEKTADGLLVLVEEEKGDGSRSHDELVLVSAAGVKTLEQFGKKLDPPYWWVELPHVKGNTWTDVWADQTRNWQTAGWEVVEVPAGKFRALRVDRDDTSAFWWAPGMGCIKWTNGACGRERTEFKSAR
jgi:hypothetical protein